jgi:hypothetical protein
MTQSKRILIAVLALVVVSGAVLGIEALRGRTSLPSVPAEITLTPGNLPIYLDGRLVAGFAPDALEGLEEVSFVDAEEGKEQDGWLLRDVLLSQLPEGSLAAGSLITVTSSSRGKTVELTWAEVEDRGNMVMFDLSNRGTLKLVSLLEKLDMRDEWIQDVDRIEVASP